MASAYLESKSSVHLVKAKLGNGRPGNGYKFRGRGLIQTTGRYNYHVIRYDNRPDELVKADVAAQSALRFWSDHKLSGMTQRRLSRAEFDRVTKVINKKRQDADLRWQLYLRALNVLGAP